MICYVKTDKDFIASLKIDGELCLESFCIKKVTRPIIEGGWNINQLKLDLYEPYGQYVYFTLFNLSGKKSNFELTVNEISNGQVMESWTAANCKIISLRGSDLSWDSDEISKTTIILSFEKIVLNQGK